MKKTIIILFAALLGSSQIFAQCSATPNDFEMKLVPVNGNTISIQMRYHQGAIDNASSILPVKNLQLAGLVFGITWPTSSSITITNTITKTAPFAIEQDKTIGQGISNKNVQDNIVTFYHTNDMPTAYGFDWTNDQWYTIATISYTGKLAGNDYISLLNCDYGLAHPNSYSGNSHTDPWFAMLNNGTELLQYSPKMITEIPSAIADKISCNIYPIPVINDLHVDVEIASASNAIVKIIDMKGTLVKTVQFELTAGKNSNVINLGELPSGDYMIVVTDGKALNFTKQIVKN
jgi:Secretion system C-terminal sorting domain